MKRDKGSAATKLAFASLICLNVVLIVMQFTKPSPTHTIIQSEQHAASSSAVVAAGSVPVPVLPIEPVQPVEPDAQVMHTAGPDKDNAVIAKPLQIAKEMEEDKPRKEAVMPAPAVLKSPPSIPEISGPEKQEQALPVVASPREHSECPHINMTVTYNVFIWPDQDWEFLVGSQLDDLAYTGLHHCANTVIALSVPEEHANHTYVQLQQLMMEALFFIRDQEVGKYATIIQEHANAFEYPGINSVYRWANSEPAEVAHNHLYLYFHAKGMVNHGYLLERVDTDIFDATILPWRAVAEQFIQHDDIRAAAWMPSERGWGWHNFWWARGSWLKKLQVPFRHPDRFFFESWLGDADPDVRAGTRVLSLCTCDFSYVEPEKIPEAQLKCQEPTATMCWPSAQRATHQNEIVARQNEQSRYVTVV